ncbi:MAG: ABC transporter substrate-binding protein [Burkholderiaceae bacterium]|nr:ABC transporter substrate-binding protein [Burkholderiaceae bacterium]
MQRRQVAAAIGAVAFSGLRGVHAAEANEIVLGQSAVISGPLGGPIKAMISGAQLAFDGVNAQGGVQGRKIRLVTLDDELAPPKAVANYKKLLDEGVVAMFGCVGSGTTAAAGKLLVDHGCASVGGYAIADSARERTGGNGFFIRASMGREAEVLVRQLTTIGITRFAVAHMDNPGGQEALALVTKALQAHQLKPVASGAVKGDSSNAALVGRELASGQPQAVIMYLSGRQPADLMPAVRAAGSDPMFYGMSIVSGEVVARVLGDRARGLAIAQVVPYPWAQADQDLQTYHRALQQVKADPNYYSFEGWLNAQVMVEALKRAGRELSRARLLAVMRSLKMRVAGVDLDFTTGSIAASRFVELVQVRFDGKFVR